MAKNEPGIRKQIPGLIPASNESGGALTYAQPYVPKIGCKRGCRRVRPAGRLCREVKGCCFSVIEYNSKSMAACRYGDGWIHHRHSQHIVHQIAFRAILRVK